MKKQKHPMRLEWIEAGSLADNPANWRKHPDGQTSALKAVLDDVGWAGALLYNERTKRLIDGHLRKASVAADAIVPVLVGAWTEEQERKILLTLDPLAGMALPDPAALAALLDSVKLDGEALAGLGENLESLLRQAEMDEQAGREVVEDEPPAPDSVPTRCKAGELWKLGEHRLLCGDSTKAEDVARVMGGERAGLCFTSPPYGLQRDYTAEAKAKLDDWEGWNSLMRGVFGNLPMTDDGQVLVNLGMIHRDGEWLPYWDGWIQWMRQQGWRRFGWYVWDQGSGLPGDWAGRFAPSHEFIFHFNRSAIKPLHVIPKDPRSIRDRTGDASMRMGAEATQRINSGTASLNTHKIPDSVLRIQRRCGRIEVGAYHPAVFPVAFPSVAMECWPSVAYEPFAGSGTTIIAAEQLGRRCFAIEISPKYCDVCIARWEKLTGKIAVK